MFEDNYNHSDIEDKIYKYWEIEDCFKPVKNKKKFSIVIPPPNVTGNLHMGHALNNTIQDILIRYYRMKGYETLWQPGTDHAGIATELVVESNLKKKNVLKKDLSREDFLKEVWKWKDESGNQIINQLKKLGASCDWSSQRFTMDESMSIAVMKIFTKLYKKKLIYKDLKLVNWDPVLKTAISDLEVVQKEVKGKLYYIKYKIDEKNYITIATTRPETIFADTAIAVNPKDKRYKKFLNLTAEIPISKKKIKIIKDEYADPKQGTGAVKITPAHDFNDYEVGVRNKLEKINIFNDDATLNKNCPEKYQNLDRFKARTIILEELEYLGLLDKVEEINHVIPYGDRSNVVIEPYLTEQWFLDVKKISKKPLNVVKESKTIFFPHNWTKIYNQWISNIQPWCISRQILWGHQIPVWYGPDKKIFCAENFSDAKKQADIYYKKKNVFLKQDTNVLDTWFSSALWPFASLGWPDKTYNLKNFYPTSVLVTGFDILFFWVARMMLMGLFEMKNVPFQKVYIHALVRDQFGQKMSKSKGNIIDPLDLIEKFGADALRFTLASMASPGRDIKLSEDRIRGYRNLITKVWNVAKYGEINKCYNNPVLEINKVKLSINLWIINEYIKSKKKIDNHIENFRFDEASKEVYIFFWNTFCDWYTEFTKPILNLNNEASEEIRVVFGFIFSKILELFHPFMPFITEEIWQKTGFGKLINKNLISYSSNLKLRNIKDHNITMISWIIEFIKFIRSSKVVLQINPGDFIDINIKNIKPDLKKFFNENFSIIQKVARIKGYFEDIKDKNVIPGYIDGVTFHIKFSEQISLENQLKKIEEKINSTLNEIVSLKTKLNNKNFVKKAPKDIVEAEKNNLKKLNDDLNYLQNIISIKH